MPVEPITTTGEILAVLSDRAFTVRLPNGKEVIGHPYSLGKSKVRVH